MNKLVLGGLVWLFRASRRGARFILMNGSCLALSFRFPVVINTGSRRWGYIVTLSLCSTSRQVSWY